MDLEAAFRESISRICGVPPQSVRRETRLDDIGLDSLAAAEVITDLEIRLGCELPMGVLRRLAEVQTVDDILIALQAATDAPVVQPAS
jgi:acyl carrier protein